MTNNKLELMEDLNSLIELHASKKVLIEAYYSNALYIDACKAVEDMADIIADKTSDLRAEQFAICVIVYIVYAVLQ